MTNHYNRQFSRRRRNNRQSTAGAKVMTLTNPSQYGALEKLIQKGPVTVILIYSPSCPHCHTYMPIWKELEDMPDKQANMVTIKASDYDQTPLSEENPIQSVPTVIKVEPNGKITVVDDIRNKTNMQHILQGQSESPVERMDPQELMSVTESLSASPKREPTVPLVVPSVQGVPGITVEENPMPVIPGETSREASVKQQVGGRQKSRSRRVTQRGGQRGGNPWAAFLASAGPAAILAGAYAALPVRSSGLLAPTRHSAKWRRIRARLTRRHKKHKHY